LDDGADIDSYIEDEHVENFKQSREKKKVYQGQNFRDRPTSRTVKRRRRQDYDHEIDYDNDSDFETYSERRNTYKSRQVRKEPVKANNNLLYKHIEFGERPNLYSGTGRSSMEPPVYRPATKDAPKVDASKLAPFEKKFYKLHRDTEKFTDVSDVCIFSLNYNSCFSSISAL